MNEDETPTTAADMLALAEQAEAEAAEAEALAAAARARARAIQLRRQADLIEHAAAAAEKTAEVSASPVTEAAAAEVEATEEEEADAPETVQSEKQDEADEATETEEVAVDDASEPAEAPDEESDVKVSPEEAATEEKPLGLGRMRRLRRRPKWSTIAPAVAILIIVAALAGSGYMIKEHHDAVRKRQRVAEFAAAARQGIVTLTSLDFNNAKQGVQRILDNSTGSFKDDFVKMADDFTKVVEQSKVVSQGTVQSAAVDLDTMTDNSAVVLVASTSEVTNAAGAKQDPRSYRLIVTVARGGDQLKISKVEFVP
ncbi:hypothetical protein [Mycobacterium sp.]|uniref:hypothetical protein n=1 Tax=Mycobacterium sp. TaxID=1785 RepID=UPI003F9BE2C7